MMNLFKKLCHIKGIGFATMEILEPDGSGLLSNKPGTYELVKFTKHNYSGSKDSRQFLTLLKERFKKLKNAGRYPYSDLNRQPVI